MVARVLPKDVLTSVIVFLAGLDMMMKWVNCLQYNSLGDRNNAWKFCTSRIGLSPWWQKKHVILDRIALERLGLKKIWYCTIFQKLKRKQCPLYERNHLVLKWLSASWNMQKCQQHKVSKSEIPNYIQRIFGFRVKMCLPTNIPPIPNHWFNPLLW